jgi:hypothetical protein
MKREKPSTHQPASYLSARSTETLYQLYHLFQPFNYFSSCRTEALVNLLTR